MEYKELYKEVTKRLNEIEDPKELTDIDMINILTNLRLVATNLYNVSSMLDINTLYWLYSERFYNDKEDGVLFPDKPYYLGLKLLGKSIHNLYNENLDNYYENICNKDFSESLISKLEEFEGKITNLINIESENKPEKLPGLGKYVECMKQFSTTDKYMCVYYVLEKIVLDYYNELLSYIKKNFYGYDGSRLIKKAYNKI